jgi:hypothetical protein
MKKNSALGGQSLHIDLALAMCGRFTIVVTLISKFLIKILLLALKDNALKMLAISTF